MKARRNRIVLALVLISAGALLGASSASGATATSIAVGETYACAVSSGGSITCWGSGAPAVPAGTYKTVSVGYEHTCAIETDATLACWGANGRGQASPPSGTFTALDAGDLHTCAIRTNGVTTCWGSNDYGESSPPSGTFSAIGAGFLDSCGVRTDGSLACWGLNGFGQTSPPAGTFRTVDSGLRFHSCAIRTDWSPACWGYNGSGQLNVPAGTFTAVGAGAASTCAIRTGGTLACWGVNDVGATDAPPGFFSALSTGTSNSCAITTVGSVVCWGNPYTGVDNVPASLTQPYAQLILGDEPVGYWRFGDASGTSAKDSAGANNGTYLRGFRLGQPGMLADDTAVGLDGQTGSVSVPDSASLRTGDSFSVEAWIKRSFLSTYGGTEGLFAKGYQVFLEGGNWLSAGWIVLRKPNGDRIAQSTHGIVDTAWHHVVVTKSGADVHIYLDGEDVTGEVANRKITDTTGTLSIGAGAASTFRGVMDEAAVYNYSLSGEQVASHYAAGR